MAEKKKRKIVTTFEGLVEALRKEVEKLQAADTYLNDEGRRRLTACRHILFLTDFCDTAEEREDLELYHELGDNAETVRDVLSD